MAQPWPEQPEPQTLERTPEQAAHESAMREVADTLRNIEQAIRRADRAQHAVAAVDESNLALALSAAVKRLEAARRELVQSAYFGGDQQRIF